MYFYEFDSANGLVPTCKEISFLDIRPRSILSHLVVLNLRLMFGRMVGVTEK